MSNQMKYGIELAMLKHLYSQNLLSDMEYDAIKSTIKKKYKIIEF